MRNARLQVSRTSRNKLYWVLELSANFHEEKMCENRKYFQCFSSLWRQTKHILFVQLSLKWDKRLTRLLKSLFTLFSRSFDDFKFYFFGDSMNHFLRIFIDFSISKSPMFTLSYQFARSHISFASFKILFTILLHIEWLNIREKYLLSRLFHSDIFSLNVLLPYILITIYCLQFVLVKFLNILIF